MTAVATSWRFKKPSVLPGFGLTLGFALFYLSVIVLIPLAALLLRPWELGVDGVIAAVTAPRVVAALQLSFGAALIASLINAVFGLIVAWMLVRYDFPGKRIIDALVDLPFALPTAVAGIALTTLYAPNGWIGQYLEPLGIKVAYTPLGVVFALTFIGLPFVVRSVQPVLADLEKEFEEAAATLGATRAQTFRRVIFPMAIPGIMAGSLSVFSLTMGDYIIPSLIGGSPGTELIGGIVADQFGVADNWPLGAALILPILIVISIFLLIANRFGALGRIER